MSVRVVVGKGSGDIHTYVSQCCTEIRPSPSSLRVLWSLRQKDTRGDLYSLRDFQSGMKTKITDEQTLLSGYLTPQTIK